MKLPSLRGRGLRPANMINRVRNRGRSENVSQPRLRRYLREQAKRPVTRLPEGPPTSVSLVVPCFRHAAYLPDMLESVVAQTRSPDEVIFVDDRSPDETGEILRSFVATGSRAGGPRLTLLVNERNMGQAASLNRGIAAASSDLVMILNDDDYLMHDAIATMLAMFGRHPGVALMGSSCIPFGGSDALAGTPKLITSYSPAEPPLHVRQPDEVSAYSAPTDLNMTHSSSCFYRVAWEAVGGYRPDKKRRVVPFSDRDFQLRINALWPVAVAETTPFALWRNDSSVDRDVNS